MRGGRISMNCVSFIMYLLGRVFMIRVPKFSSDGGAGSLREVTDVTRA